MRILFIRHGEPNYEKDCLTKTGHIQAAAAAERLAGEGITKIYSSPFGRAFQPAEYTARKLSLPITVLDFMHEITWGGEGIPENGHPWTLSDWVMKEEDLDLSEGRWREHPYFKTNAVTADYDRVSGEFDKMLEGWGYRHEGHRFYCIPEEKRIPAELDDQPAAKMDDTIAIFSHGGSGGIVLSHLLALPFPFVLSVMPYDFTSVIVLDFPDTPGEYVFPRLELFNDAAHIHSKKGPVIQKQVDSSHL